MFAGVQGRQIAGRFTVIPAASFAYGTAEQRETWRSLVASLESLLRLHHQPAGGLVARAEYLYRRSGGMIGSLSQLVRGAANLGHRDPHRAHHPGAPRPGRLRRVPAGTSPRALAPSARPLTLRADATTQAATRGPTGTARNLRLLPHSSGRAARSGRRRMSGEAEESRAGPRPGTSRPVRRIVLAEKRGIPGRNAGAAGEVLSTVNQIGGAVGIAVPGTIFFTAVTGSANGTPVLPDYSHALSIVLIVSAALYLITALVMLALPKAAVEHTE
ncbi:MFS transporter [Nonomuraea jabiensis]|uniref:hypothetical protein n=1 Tax=Nonomuraea jabiensis TaxID=882448 RepID=UPI00369B6014